MHPKKFFIGILTLKVESAIVARKAQARIERRINGIDYPGGNGVPQRYAIEYEATLSSSVR